MKNILITGKNSYVGTSVEKWLQQYPDTYKIDTLDMLDPDWINFDFSKYDVVFHVAGIAHMKEKRKNKDLYFKVNRNLAIEVARKAKESGVRQFIFMSSMSVYGLLTGVITKDTVPKPKTYYGKSKYEAELEINNLNDENFSVVILRPPMIYGEGSPGNYQKLEKLAKYMRFIPKIENKRSVLHVHNLAVEVKKIIDDNLNGLFLPQDDKFLVTNEVIRNVRSESYKKTNNCLLMTIGIKFLMIFSRTLKKLYGSLYYNE